MDKQADNGGLRYDDSKPRIDLIPTDALLSLAEVYTKACTPSKEFPEGKYPPRNWERGMLWSRCYNSLMRHTLAWQAGEDKDAESGLHHMAHVAWNALALLSYYLRGIGSDDRPSRPKPESRLDTIQRLLDEEFQAVLIERGRLDDAPLKHVREQASRLPGVKNCMCRDCINDRIARQNKDAAKATDKGVMYKAVEIYDHGIFERNENGELRMVGLTPGKPRIDPTNDFWVNRAAGSYTEIKVGTDLLLNDRPGRFRVLADVGTGRFSVNRIFARHPTDRSRDAVGPAIVIHLSQVRAVV